jgi:phospholipase/lecithinase/hemolysin
MRVRFLSSLILIALLCFPLPRAEAAPYSRLVVFGDSLSDTGNMYALTRGRIPVDPPYEEGRYSNGPVWPEYLASAMGVPMENYAHGSALSGYRNLEGAYPGMRTQVDAYVASHPSGADPNGLYVVWVGANDILGLRSAAAVSQTVAAAVANISTVLGQLALVGARHIVLGLMPDLGLTPYASGPNALAPKEALTALSRDFNNHLLEQVGKLGIPVRVMDSFQLLRDVVANPRAYGFRTVDEGCVRLSGRICRRASRYLFWDDRHPTTKGHAILADYIADRAGADDTTSSAPGLYDPYTALFQLFDRVSAEARAQEFRFGQAQWVPLVGDWNADGRDTVGLYNPETSRFFQRNENTSGPSTTVFQFGQKGWVPLRGDWDGDGVDTVGVYNPDGGRFFLRDRNAQGASDYLFTFGARNRIPIAGDWDGDGRDSVGVYNTETSTFFLRNANSAGAASYRFQFGQANWIPIVGDWDQNGTDTVGVYNPASGRFFMSNVNRASAADTTVKLGEPGRLPIAGDWDGPEP